MAWHRLPDMRSPRSRRPRPAGLTHERIVPEDAAASRGIVGLYSGPGRPREATNTTEVWSMFQRLGRRGSLVTALLCSLPIAASAQEAGAAAAAPPEINGAD